jgi:predicted nucleic acid-binding protein
MILVDTCVILDLVRDDPEWAGWSSSQLARHEGRLAVNPMIFTELCYAAGSATEVNGLLDDLSLEYLEFSREALFIAARAFGMYKRRGGIRTAPLPDFFIGAHARALNIPLLTRDITRFRSYFPDLAIISPEKEEN